MKKNAERILEKPSNREGEEKVLDNIKTDDQINQEALRLGGEAAKTGWFLSSRDIGDLLNLIREKSAKSKTRLNELKAEDYEDAAGLNDEFNRLMELYREKEDDFKNVVKELDEFNEKLKGIKK